MIVHNNHKKTTMIKCALCGYSFEKGQKTSCADCSLNYGSCRFEKCPNCGYDNPQSSYLWTLVSKVVDKFRGTKRK